MNTQQILPRRSPIHFGFSNVTTLGSLLLVWLFSLLGPSATAQEFSFTVIDLPGFVGEPVPTGINDSGTVVGSYISDQSHGFVYANGKLTTLDHEGHETRLLSINNNGQMLLYDLYNGGYFIYSAGQFRPLGTFAAVSTGQHPACDAANQTLYTDVYNIVGFNDSGQVAGVGVLVCDKFTGAAPVFGTPVLGNPGATYPPDTNGTFTQLNCPMGSSFKTQGFLVTGLNDAGQGGTSPTVVGVCGSNGVVFSGGSATILKFPGNAYGTPWGINNSGQIVGSYQPTSNSDITFGVLLNGSHPVTVLPKNAISSDARAINNRGQIAGSFSDSNGFTHGFITAPFSPRGPVLLDPVPDLLSGTEISRAATAADAVAGQPYLADPTKGRIVQGLATDGVAQVIIRIPADSVGNNVTVNLQNAQCAGLSASDCNDQYGLVFDPVNPPKPPKKVFSQVSGDSPIMVTSVSTQNGPMAFVAYRAPVDFVRAGSDDQNASKRSVVIQVNNGKDPDLSITLVRPPVFLIHGIFSSKDVFNNFSPVIQNPLLHVVPLDYSDDIDSHVTGTVPADLRTWAHIRRNVVGVAYNAPLLLDDMVSEIDDFKMDGSIPIAAVQGDIVAHSLGGLMARGMAHVGTDYPMTDTETSFDDNESYGQGYIHKLITLGTPHLGTNLALRLVNGENDCTRHEAAHFGDYNFNLLTIDGRDYYGAASDLSGDPTQAILSPTLTLLNRPRSSTIPTGFLAAYFTADNKSPALAKNGFVAKLACGTKSYTQTPHGASIQLGDNCAGNAKCTVKQGDFLADNYSFDDWHKIFSNAPGDPVVRSDALVPVDSAIFGQNVYWLVAGVVHGPGTIGTVGIAGHFPFIDPHVGFAGPQLLDPLSLAPAKVLQLLNTSIRDTTNFVDIP